MTTSAKFTRRLSHAAPQLSGREWQDVAHSLQEWLEMATSIFDSLGTKATDGGFDGVTGTGMPDVVQGGDVGNPGDSSSGVAANDHQHPVETAAPSGLANANSIGTGTALMRASAGIKRDVRVRANGLDVGTRNALDFLDASNLIFIVADDPGTDAVTVFGVALPVFSTFFITVADTPYAVAFNDGAILVDASGGAVTVSLPAASSEPGRLVHVKKIDASANAVTVDAAGADLIDGSGTVVLAAQYDAVRLVSDGVSAWWLL